VARLTNQDRIEIESLIEKKQRTLDKVRDILGVICRDNRDILQRDPEARLKKVVDIERKIRHKKKFSIGSVEREVRDIAGARITCCTLDEIHEAEDLIKKHPDIEECKVTRKYEDGPDEHGYRGHHLEVAVRVSYKNEVIRDTCEIQIRTLAADLWAVLSRRDFYRSPSKPPALIREDMLTLGKQLEVVDELALSLKRRIREEVKREARERPKKKLAEKDMLTPDNVVNLVRKMYRKRISIDAAYQLVQYVLSSEVTSLKQYKDLISSSEYKSMIIDIYRKYNLSPPLEDLLYAPIFAKLAGTRATKKVLREQAQALHTQTVSRVEKGVEISKEDLEKEIKVSRPKKRKKKR